MAASDSASLATLLKRLTKDELINIIITKNVPQNTALSEQSIKQLDQFLKCRSDSNFGETDCSGDTQVKVTDVLPSGEDITGTKNSQLVSENGLLQKLCQQMEGRIAEQVTLISLLKEKRENFHQQIASKTGSPLPSSTLEYKVSPMKQPVTGERKKPVNQHNRERAAEEKQGIVRGSGQTPTVPLGTTETTFAAVARRACFYIGNINPQTTKDEVLQYVRLRRPNDEFIIEELPKREGAFSRAFKLTTDFGLIEVVNKPDFWPKDVVVKKFFRISNRPGIKSRV